jgi:vanillate O-demethylase monooxygenase subunit
VKYGLIWVCLSGEPKNELPVWEPEADNPEFLRFTMGPEEWDCSAGRAIENFIDNAHFSFVHRNTFGQESSAAQGTEYEFQETETWMTMAFDYMAANPEDSPIAQASQLQRHMHRTLFLPFCTRTAISYPGGREHIIHINVAPISAKKCQLIVVFTRNFDKDVPVEDLLKWERAILGEDRAMIEKQKPEEIPLEVSIEIHAKADKASIAFRRWLKKVGLGRSFTS